MNTNFNSIKVRLKQNELRDKFRKLLFQFHKGTIKTILYISTLKAI